MASLLRQVVFPACRRLHQGALAMFIPKNTQTIACRYCSAQPEGEQQQVKDQAEGRKLTAEEEQQMKELFDEYDTDGSGEISRDELYEIVERVIGSHTSSMHIVDKILGDCDEDGNESITFEEFKTGIKSYMEFFLQTD